MVKAAASTGAGPQTLNISLSRTTVWFLKTTDKGNEKEEEPEEEEVLMRTWGLPCW